MRSGADGGGPAGEPAEHVHGEAAQEHAPPADPVGERSVEELGHGEPGEEERHRELHRGGLDPEGLGGGRQGGQRHVDRQRADRHHGREQDGDRAAQPVGRSRGRGGREV